MTEQLIENPENSKPLNNIDRSFVERRQKMQTQEQLATLGHDVERQQILDQRNKPTHADLEHQAKKTEEVFDNDLQPEYAKMEKEIMDKYGEGMSVEEIEEFRKMYHEIFRNMSPEFAEYVKNLNPRIQHLILTTTKLKEQGDPKEALMRLVEFLKQEQEFIDKDIKDPQLAEYLKAYLGAVLNTEAIKKEMSHQTKLEILSAAADCIPVIGSVKMLTEATVGKTLDGDKLEGKGRAWHAAKGVGSGVMDGVFIAGLIGTGGAASAAVEGGKVAAVSARLAGEGAEIAAVVTKFAAICEKTAKLSKVSGSIYKFGKLIGKYPKLTYAIVQLYDKRDDIADMYHAGKDNYKFSKMQFSHKQLKKAA